MTPDDIPSCVCTAHPKGDDLKKYMVVVEETPEHVVWCCQRCTEISHVSTIQVRTLKRGREKAAHAVAERRRTMDPRLLRMLHARKRGGMTIREMEDQRR